MNKIQDGSVDVLLTHGPPAYMENGLSLVLEGEDVGCEDLYNAIKKRVKPKISAFGHIHEGFGIEIIGEKTYINASFLNFNYQPMNYPIIFDTEEKKSYIFSDLD